MLIDPYLKRAVLEGLNEKSGPISNPNYVNHLKILLLAHDYKFSVPALDDLDDWIGVLKQLLDKIEGNEGLILRLLRYLQCEYCKESEFNNKIPLLLMNTFNKVTQLINYQVLTPL